MNIENQPDNQKEINYEHALDIVTSFLVQDEETENGLPLETMEIKRQKARHQIEKNLNDFETDFQAGYEILIKELATRYWGANWDAEKLPTFFIKI